MKFRADREIGKRAAEEILRKGAAADQLRSIGLDRNNFYHWKSGESCPDARALQAMQASGYDIDYILSGKRKQT